MDVRLDDLKKAWLSYLAGLQRAPATLKAYESDLTLLAAYLGGDDLRKLTPQRAQEYVGWLSTRPHPRARGGRAPGLGHAARGILRRLSSVTSFCQWLVKRGDLKRNPFDDLAKPKHPALLPRAVPVEWVGAILKLPTISARDRALAAILRYAGLRIGGVERLDLEDIGRDAIRVWEKGNKERLVPMDPLLVAPLDAWLQVRGPAPGPLFTNYRGDRLSKTGIYQIVQGLIYKAGLPRFTPHQLRHTCAIQLLEAGLALPHLQEFLGHNSLATTSVYTKMTAQAVKQACHTAWERREGGGDEEQRARQERYLRNDG